MPAADEQILFRLPAYQDVGITMGDCRKALAALSTAPVAGADAAMRERAVKVEEAAQAVIDRWESPAWKDRPATATYINNLRAALYSHDAPPQL
ncbi:MAG: hypothetical protein JWQ24_275 [Tardiphaga sp.]|nr:hypothetical protein [Tardiphaga sp.]